MKKSRNRLYKIKFKIKQVEQKRKQREQSELESAVTAIRKECKVLTDKQKEILIGCMANYHKKKSILLRIRSLQKKILSTLKNPQIRERRLLDFSEESLRTKMCQDLAAASQKRLKTVREIKTFSYMAKVFNNKKLDSFLKNYYLTRILGVLSFSIYSLRLLTNSFVYLRSCVGGYGTDQWNRVETNIYNDFVWSGINGLDFLVFIGKVSIPFSSILLPVINASGYAFDLWNEVNDMNKTIKSYDNILSKFKTDERLRKVIKNLLETDKIEKINKHRVSTAIASNLLVFNFAASILTIGMVAASVSNPTVLGGVFALIAICALTTVFCSHIKSIYKKDNEFRQDVDGEIGFQKENEKFSLARNFKWGLILFKLYLSRFRKSMTKTKGKCCRCLTLFRRSTRSPERLTVPERN